jgi:serine/threonine protein kinase
VGVDMSRMPARADEQLRQLMSGILQKDPEERFTLDQIFDHAWCDTSSLDINLTEELSKLAQREDTKKKNLMKQYMEEADSEDEVSDATTADEDDDGMDQERERQYRDGGRRAGEESESVLQKRKNELNHKKLSVLQPADSGGSGGCVIC